MCLGLTGQVVEVDGAAARVRADGRLLVASLMTLDEPVEPGDWVLTHAGFVLGRLTEEEARQNVSMQRAVTVAEGEG